MATVVLKSVMLRRLLVFLKPGYGCKCSPSEGLSTELLKEKKRKETQLMKCYKAKSLGPV